MVIEEDELILLIRTNNEEALGLLFSCLETNFKYFEKKYYLMCKNIGLDRDDLRQYLRQYTIEAINNYTIFLSNFYAYWKLVVTRMLYGLITYHNAKSRNDGNFVIYLEDKPVETLAFILPSEIDPINNYSLREDYDNVLNEIERRYGKCAKEIMNLWNEGYEYQEIAKRCGVKLSRVNYFVTKIIKDLKSELKK